MNKSKHIRTGDGNVCVTDMCEKCSKGSGLAGESFFFSRFTVSHYKSSLYVLIG